MTQERSMPLELSRIGQILKETRENKGLKLEDVSASLFLRKSIVNALESGNWDVLPHEVYVKGYLNQCAAFLSIEDVIAECLQPPPIQPEEPSAILSEESKGSLPVSYHRHWAQNLRDAYPAKRFVIYGLGMAVLVGFFAYQNINKPNSVPTPAGHYAVSTTGYENSARSSDGSAAVLELKKLVIACQERTWLRIVIDETEKKEFMLNPEEMVAFNAKEGFDLLVGNAGGVTLFYNGKNIGFQGENGEVKRVRLP
jgi:cytoskeleton protein RodZ